MGKDLLVPLDQSPPAQAALTHAVTEFPDATITLLHVINPMEPRYQGPISAAGVADQWYDERKETATELFDEARANLPVDTPPTITTTIEMGTPAHTIVEYARETDVDHIIMGSHGRSGVSRLLLGSVAERVVRQSPVPVTVVR